MPRLPPCEESIRLPYPCPRRNPPRAGDSGHAGKRPGLAGSQEGDCRWRAQGTKLNYEAGGGGDRIGRGDGAKARSEAEATWLLRDCAPMGQTSFLVDLTRARRSSTKSETTPT